MRAGKGKPMAQNPPEGTQRISPYLYYEDGAAALEFLSKAFGFVEKMAMKTPDGHVMHAEIGYDANVVMLGTPLDDDGTPRKLKGLPRHSSVHCYVDDVDAHYAQAKAAGAAITAELSDKFYGDRSYTATDPEGHEWNFSTHVRDIAPEDMKPPSD